MYTGFCGAVLLSIAPLMLSAQLRTNEEVSIDVSASNPVYLYSHFRDDDEVHLRLSYSFSSATSWHEVNAQGSFAATALRDPSVMYDAGANTFYFIVTPAGGTRVQFFSSGDLV